MKYSSYAFFVPKNNNVICYNTFTDSMILISEKAYEDFRRKGLSSFENDYPKVFKTFFENGFIVDDDVDELKLIKEEHDEVVNNSKLYHLVVLPTIDCNLRCWYCFETHVRGRISKEVRNNIVQHIKNKIDRNEINGIVLDFFGGEPLLNFNEDAYPLAKELQHIMQECGFEFSSFFTTNGTLIDENIIHKLSEIDPYFQITIDGCRERHNKIRFYKKNSKGSYDDIIRSIHLINTYIPEARMNIRINYDNQTLNKIEEVLNDLIDIDRKRVTIHFERVWQVAIEKGNKKLIDLINLFSLNGFHVTYLNWRRCSCSCKADKWNEAAINYDGTVYKCTGRDFSADNVEGVLTKDGEIQWKSGVLENRLGRATYDNEKCLACKMLPVCMGPCSQKLLELKDKEDISGVCMFNALEMEFDEYVELLYNNRVLCERYNNGAL